MENDFLEFDIMIYGKTWACVWYTINTVWEPQS